MPILANVIQDAFSPLISLFESIMVFIHAHLVGGSWGLAIVGLTVLIRAVLVPLTFRQLKSMQEMQRLAPQISGAEREVQGGQTAPAAGDDEVLPGEQNQSFGILPAAAAAAAGVHLAVLHAAHGPEDATSAGRQLREFYGSRITQRNPRTRPCHVRRTQLQGHREIELQHGRAALGEVPVPAGHHEQGHRRRADRADRAVRRLAGRLDARWRRRPPTPTSGA